jgi:hypothetical protein
MKRNLFLYISICALIGAVASCRQASRNEKQEIGQEAPESVMLHARAKQDSIPRNGYGEKSEGLMLQGDSLSKEELEGMRKRAVQKFEDYHSYLEIICNNRYDTALRNHARLLAIELFADQELGKRKVDSIQRLHPDSVSLVALNSRANDYVMLLKDSTYYGMMSYNKVREDKSEYWSAPFIVVKTRKQFGSKEVKIWEVFLR